MNGQGHYYLSKLSREQFALLARDAAADQEHLLRESRRLGLFKYNVQT